MKNMTRYITIALLVLAAMVTATAQSDVQLPGDPGHPVAHHKLKIVSTEAFNIRIEVYTHNDNGSWFTTWPAYDNITQSDANISMTLEEGDSIKIWNSTYSWSGWEYTYMTMDGKKIHENQHLDSYGVYEMPAIVMPDHDVVIEVYATFDPSTPGVEQADNPFSGMWNAETGEVFVNNFVPYIPGYQSGYYGMGKGGYLLGGAIQQVLYNYNVSGSDVKILTVSGEMGVCSYYSGYLGFENTHTIDLRHTYGYKSYYGLWCNDKTWYDNIFDQAVYTPNLKRLILPSNIVGIGDGVFGYQQSFGENWQLEELSCYAVTPPMVNDNTLSPLPVSCVLLVPEQSVAAYKADKHWSRFTTIKGIQEAEDVTVDLPDNFTDGRYRGMSLELLNAENGESRKYVVDERGQYVYRGLVSGARYTALLRSAKNGIIAQTDTMLLDDQPIEMTFPRVVGMDEVVLTVKVDNQDVTNDVTIGWTDRKGASLGSGPKLEQQLEGSRVYYSIKLPSQLATLYQQPPTTEHIVGTNSNVIAISLQPLDSVSVSGVVRDANGNRVGGATVVIAQTVNGQISKSFVTTADISGKYALKALAGQVARSISATGYITNRQEMTLSSEKAVTDTTTLAPLSGAVITYGFSYTESVLHGETATTSASYSDYQNVGITAYNETTGKELIDISVQYPQVVMMSGARTGDLIRLTATSMTDAFKPVTATATLSSEETASVTLPIVQFGGIEASFQQTDNSQVTASLYDSNGKLRQTYNYDEATIRMTEIPDGSYTLVTMGGSTLFSSILSLSDYATIGLKEGTDYMKNEVTVKSGEIISVANTTIPVLNESDHFYTDESATSFKINKTEVSVGYNVTLRATLGFKSAYRQKVSNVSLIVDLPSNGQMVEGSAMTGTKLTRSTVSGNRVTIPISIDELDQNTRFAVATSAEGSFSPTAYVQFSVDGREVLQPIGTVSCNVQGLTINVPETVCSLTVPVQGTSPSRSFVTIYSGNTELGQTTAREDGTWVSYVELPTYPNLSKIPIHCKMTTKQGLEFYSQTATTTYDQDYVRVDHVYMWYEGQFVDFDYNHPDLTEEQSYSTGLSNVYTFAVEFNTTDSAKVVSPTLFVKLTNGEWDTVESLTYNKDKGWWMGSYQLWHGEGVCNVDVDFQQGEHDTKLDADAMFATVNEIEYIKESLQSTEAEIERLVQLVVNSTDGASQLEALEQLLELTGIDVTKIDPATYAGKTFEQVMQEAETLVKDGWTSDILNNASIYGTIGEGFTISHTTGLTPQQLKNEGYQEVKMTNGDTVYQLYDATRFVHVDFTNDIRMEVIIDASQMAQIKAFHRTPNPDMYDTFVNWLGKFNDKITEVTTGLELFNGAVDKVLAWLAQNIASTEKCIETIWVNAQQVNRLTGGSLKFAEYANKNFSRLCKQKQLYESVEGFLKDLKATGPNADAAVAAFAKTKPDSFLGKAIQTGLGSLKFIGEACSWLALIADLNDGINKERNLWKLYESVPFCEDDQQSARQIEKEVMDFFTFEMFYFLGLCTADAICINGIKTSLLAILPTSGASFVGVLTGVAGTIIKYVSNMANGLAYDNNYSGWQARIADLMCDYSKWKQKIRIQHLMEKKFARNRDVNVLIDPSGFIYEGVTDNRVENAITTIYYKWEGEDEYGDLHNEAVKWNAEDYGQQNPLLTDVEGKYQWDVPKGLWQVKVEKDGYETAYSEWLPVPPPQLDVNIGIVQKSLPDVKTARAYEDGIEVEFNKYMRPGTLNTQNIWLTQGSQKLACTIEQLNAGKNWAGDSAYVSRLLIRPMGQLSVDSKIGLFIRRQVESYAGLQMQNDYEQEFTVVREIRSLEVEPNVDVDINHERTFVVRAYPAAAASGKTVKAVLNLSGFVGINSEATFDANGEAQFTVNGLMPGESVATFTIDDSYASAHATVRVLSAADAGMVAVPTASRISGTSVNSGETVTLHCATEGAQIWYTLDGSCPCDENGTRQLYTAPIIITADMELKAYAVRGEDASEVVSFTYYIATGMDAVQTASQKVPTAYYSPNGQRLLRPQKGINIVLYEDGTTRKIVVK